MQLVRTNFLDDSLTPLKLLFLLDLDRLDIPLHLWVRSMVKKMLSNLRNLFIFFFSLQLAVVYWLFKGKKLMSPSLLPSLGSSVLLSFSGIFGNIASLIFTPETVDYVLPIFQKFLQVQPISNPYHE